MRVPTRQVAWFVFPLLAFLSLPAHSQNLLVNPGFDKDLAGWTEATSTFPSSTPGHVEASVAWGPADSNGSAASGGAVLHARAETFSSATAGAAQCTRVSEGTLVSFGAKVLTTRQYSTAAASVSVAFFASADCSGAPLGSAYANQPTVIGHDGPTETNSGGLWLPVASQAVVPGTTGSISLEIDLRATGTSFYGLSYADEVVDDAFLTLTPVATAMWILPSSAWTGGAGGSHWSTVLTLSNPGSTDAAVTLKFLGHDVDGRGGKEFAYVVRAGETLVPDEETWQISRVPDWGAILVTSSSVNVAVQSETSTAVVGGGTVGQALAAFGPADYAGTSPKTLAPIREDASFRTNLVLANPTEIPVTAHIVLFAADGTQIGAQDVALAPLGMTQLSRVAALLGATALDLGRISVSTPTPGGLVAAYASVIDNVTNDPRTLLPR